MALANRERVGRAMDLPCADLAPGVERAVQAPAKAGRCSRLPGTGPFIGGLSAAGRLRTV